MEPGRAESETIDWLSSLANSISAIVDTSLIVMPADSYAERNNFNMKRAWTYWDSTAELWEAVPQVTFLAASAIEQTAGMPIYRKQEAYALEALNPATRSKIVKAAEKYSGQQGLAAYEAAADYAMRRAAEARFVEYDLQALWISPNWPERDAMCGNAPRIYMPESLRTPWLKEQSNE